MGFAHTIRENFDIAVGGSPATYSAAAQATNWVQLAGVGRQALLVCLAGELDADMTVAVYEATDNAGSGAQAIAGLTGTFTNGTDEGGYGLITVASEDLSDGYDFVTAYVTPGATDAFACVWVIGQLHEYAADNSDAAFNDYL